jgi:hypothetical protein
MFMEGGERIGWVKEMMSGRQGMKRGHRLWSHEKDVRQWKMN